MTSCASAGELPVRRPKAFQVCDVSVDLTSASSATDVPSLSAAMAA